MRLCENYWYDERIPYVQLKLHVDGVESRSELLIPSTQLGKGGVVMDSTKSFLTPSTKLDEGGVVMDITESRLFRGEPSPSGFHAMFTNL